MLKKEEKENVLDLRELSGVNGGWFGLGAISKALKSVSKSLGEGDIPGAGALKTLGTYVGVGDCFNAFVYRGVLEQISKLEEQNAGSKQGPAAFINSIAKISKVIVKTGDEMEQAGQEKLKEWR